jgi:hypothetical protein
LLGGVERHFPCQRLMSPTQTRPDQLDNFTAPAPVVREQLEVKHSIMVLAGYTLLYLLFFSPVLFSNHLLAPGDGIIYFLPNFASPSVLWDQRIWGGFPAVGDSQLMTWYPLARFFSLFGEAGYQPFIISAYVLASSFTYGFVHALTRSRFAALISGCVYGLCAFMISHVGHAALIHSAAWLPLVIWSLWKLQEARLSRVWFLVAALSVANSALAGHPQIFAYTMSTAAAFVLITGWRAAFGRLRYFLISILVVVIGCGLAAIQLLPTAELAGLSWRAALAFKEFVAYEVPLRQVAMFIFPLLYGGSPDSFYATKYFGAWPSSLDGWGATELSGAVGLLALMLATIGFLVQRRQTQARFWVGVCLIAFLLTLGESTPLARLVYILPVLNKFRVPARHFLELTFALSILAGYGVSALQLDSAKRGLLKRVLFASGSGLIVCVISLWLFAGKINELAIQFIGRQIHLKPWANPAVAVPLLLFCLLAVVLLYWQKVPTSRLRSAVLIAALLLDLGSFGWFYEWHYRSPYKDYLNMPSAARSFRDELDMTHQRLLPVRGGTGRVNELPPNLSKLWGINSASGYGPFIITRVSRLLTMPPHGSVDESWRDPGNLGLDLLAVRYVVVPPDDIGPPSRADEEGTKWLSSDFAVDVGTGCNPGNPINYKLDLPQAVASTSVALVGALACSVSIPDGQEVFRLTLASDDGRSVMQTFRAGTDFSEWAYDCADVAPTMKHSRARVFSSYPAQRGSMNCLAHQYVARERLNYASTSVTDSFPVRHLELSWTGPAGTFALRKITLLNDLNQTSIPVAPVAGSLGDPTRWRQVGVIKATSSKAESEETGTGVLFENLRSRPRAWLVPEVLRLSAADVFTTVRTSRLPDGRAFDPSRLALVEEPVPFLPQQSVAGANAQVVGLSESRMEIRTTSAASSFLVTSDVFYPGWRATLDGAPVAIYQTDYALRGVVVPGGTHVVRFEFVPRSFYYGVGLTILMLIALVGGAVFLPRVTARIETQTN